MPAAVAWAEEAGLSPSPVAQVEAALARERDFVESQFFALLGTLGLETG
ncbi:hypothetical protein ACPCHT_38135 [Nucisporomicrobium flavum]|nr:hypothetical protein [Nucisporomicrobium flavum]